MAFTNEQLERYSRHIILKEVGAKGQKKLLNAKVLVIGAGGLGAPVAMYLAAAGVGTIGIVDADVVDLSNLQRQIIHATADVGKPKVQSAKETMEAMNPDVKVGKLLALWLPKKMYGQAKVVELRRLSAELCGRIIDTYRESLNTLDLSGEYEQKAQELRALVSSELGIMKADDNLPKDFRDVEQEVANIETEMKRLKERSEALKSGLLALMQKYDVKKWEGERVTLTRKLASKRTGVDSKKLQAEYPDVWAACQKTTEVGESLTIKIK